MQWGQRENFYLAFYSWQSIGPITTGIIRSRFADSQISISLMLLAESDSLASDTSPVPLKSSA
jgi:hypothetical protein